MSTRSKLRRVLRTRPRNYQVKGVRFILGNQGRVLLADDMGLGKTLQATGYLALKSQKRPVVCVVPATLKYNWQRELKKHAGLKSYICEGFLTTPEQDAQDLNKILRRISNKKRRKKWKHKPASYFKRLRRSAKKRFQRKKQEQRIRIRQALKAKILIVNYEILEAWAPTLKRLKPKVVIFDEVHYIKNRGAKRTKACQWLSRRVPHIIALSGTPITNAPVEFFPILQILKPSKFPSFMQYAFRYCDPKRGFRGSWDFRGASNLRELRHRVSPFMIRRLKKNVLKSLPRKQRIIIPIEITNRREYERAKRDFILWLTKREGRRAVQRAKGAMALVRLGKLKKLAAEGKLKAAVQWINDFLEETNRKLVVFAIHKTILAELQKKFPNAAVITGSTPMKLRQKAIDRFMQHRSCRIFLGQLKAAGVGINLQHASTTLTLELAWNDAAHEQAEDRVLRIGQKAKKVENYYLVGRNTIEEWLLEVLHKKQVIIDRVLEGGSVKGKISLLKMLEGAL